MRDINPGGERLVIALFGLILALTAIVVALLALQSYHGGLPYDKTSELRITRTHEVTRAPDEDVLQNDRRPTGIRENGLPEVGNSFEVRLHHD